MINQIFNNLLAHIILLYRNRIKRFINSKHEINVYELVLQTYKSWNSVPIHDSNRVKTHSIRTTFVCLLCIERSIRLTQ